MFHSVRSRRGRAGHNATPAAPRRKTGIRRTHAFIEHPARHKRSASHLRGILHRHLHPPQRGRSPDTDIHDPCFRKSRAHPHQPLLDTHHTCIRPQEKQSPVDNPCPRGLPAFSSALHPRPTPPLRLLHPARRRPRPHPNRRHHHHPLVRNPKI